MRIARGASVVLNCSLSKSLRKLTAPPRPVVISSALPMAARRQAFSSQSHYEDKSADAYDDAFFYEPGAYMEWLCSLVKNRLQLNEQKKLCRLLDIGGGTGQFTRMIVENTLVSGVVVDPFLEKSSNVPEDTVTFIKAAAEAFKEPTAPDEDWRANPYHFVLLKEVVHHLEDRVDIFRGMREGMVDPATMLIVTRPQRDIDYPLWDAAREVWAANQPSLENLVEDLRDAGYKDIQHTLECYPCSISLQRWQSMVKNRFWSTFSNFSDEELEAACLSIEEAERKRIVDGKITFEDRLLFILARK